MPGTVFPTLCPRPTTSRGERELHAHLTAQLPDGWFAWHSVALTVGASEWIGEADFIVACPTRGILVLEVKSGHVVRRGGLWYQGKWMMKRSPRDQARDFSYRLSAQIEAAGGGRVPFASACVFPHMKGIDNETSDELSGAVLHGLDLEDLGAALLGLFERLVPARKPPMFALWKRALHGLWGDRWVPKLDVTTQVAEAERRCMRLDREQLDLLEMYAEMPRLMIFAGAGTGKTIVGREIGLRRAREGKNVLVLCFTEPLAATLDAGFVEARAAGLTIEAAPVRRYAQALLGRVGIAPPAKIEQSYWDDVSFRAAVEAFPAAHARPDFIIVDESQDFADGDWALVEALAVGREIWTFGDDRQQFWGDRKMPESLRKTLAGPMRLRVQQRSAEAIAALMEKYSEGSNAVAESREAKRTSFGAGEGGGEGDDGVEGYVPPADEMPTEPVRVEVCPREHIERKIDREVRALLSAGVKPGDIAILSLAGQTHARVMKLETVGGQRVARAGEAGAETMIVADTCLRFKGLERAVVIVTDLPGDVGKAMEKADLRMHIALSRARVGVIVVGSKEAVGGDGRLGEAVARRTIGSGPSNGG